MNGNDQRIRRIDTRRRIERIMAKRRAPVIAAQLAKQRLTLRPWSEAELREAWGR